MLALNSILHGPVGPVLKRTFHSGKAYVEIPKSRAHGKLGSTGPHYITDRQQETSAWEDAFAVHHT